MTHDPAALPAATDPLQAAILWAVRDTMHPWLEDVKFGVKRLEGRIRRLEDRVAELAHANDELKAENEDLRNLLSQPAETA